MNMGQIFNERPDFFSERFSPNENNVLILRRSDGQAGLQTDNRALAMRGRGAKGRILRNIWDYGDI